MFYYLHLVWDKFYEVSRGIEQALDEFDKAWAASGQEGGPNFKLRQAYCFWIDDYLLSIEKRYQTWIGVVRVIIKEKFTRAEKWVENQLGENGGAS